MLLIAVFTMHWQVSWQCPVLQDWSQQHFVVTQHAEYPCYVDQMQLDWYVACLWLE